jgi:flagellar biosynthesis chaperone FliJ
LFRRAKSDNTRAKATISVSTLIATKNAMSFWDSVATGAQNAAETTKLVSIRTKLQAEVLYFEQQIKQIMQNFGVECFPHMEQSNSGLVQQAFLNAQRSIEEYRAKIEEKTREINELNQQIENVGK